MTEQPHTPSARSDVEWLDSYPMDWDSTEIARLATGGSNSFTDGDWIESPYIESSGIRLVQTGNVQQGYFREQGDRYISEATFRALRCKYVLPGDLLICRLGDPVGRTCIAPDLGVRMITSVDVCILRVNESNDVRFLNYLLNCMPFMDYVASLVRGSTRDRVSRKMLGKFRLPRPPLHVQVRIADFLDHETAQIDELITKQNALIELLGERRKAVIAKAVTVGLNPSVLLKATGSERLPKIPESWTFPEIGWNALIGNGSTPNRGTAEFWSEGTVPWLNSSHVNRDRVADSDQFVTEYARTACHLPMVAPESVLVGLTGEGKTRGMATVLGIPATINQHLAYLTPHGGRLRPQFLYWAIAASYMALRELSGENGSTKGGLTCSALKHFRIALPPLVEQEQISDYLAEATGQIDRTVARAGEFITLATERRSAIITAAVTGKIDARGAA